MNIKINHKAVRRLVLLTTIPLAIGIAIGAAVGRLTAPKQHVVYHRIVEQATEQEQLSMRYYNIPLSYDLQEYIAEICNESCVPVPLVLAVIEQESQFDANAISKTNDYGLMQINKLNHPEMAEKFHCTDMLDSYQNVYCGIKILGNYIFKYDGNITKALMAYNMGERGAERAWAKGVTSTKYTDIVLELVKKYE